MTLWVGILTADYTLMIGTSYGVSNILNITISNASTAQTLLSNSNRIDASFSELILTAGTYWLTFNSRSNLYGSASVSGSSLFQISKWGTGRRENSASSFILTGITSSVAEPTSLALFCLGLSGIGFFRKKC